MTLTIKEAKGNKRALEAAIAQELQRFSELHGLTVTSVFTDPVIVLGSPASYRVEVEVRL
jgi:flavin-binding protein dodecin